MKKILLSAAAFAVVAVSAVAVAPTTSEAVPAFARQTGAACLSCHFNRIPKLTAFGANFRINAFRDMGEQALLEDDGLSLPATFNSSLIFKAQVRSDNGAAGAFGSGSKNAIMWPEEAALLVGGRYGEHLGGLTEIGLVEPAAALSYKIAYVLDTDMGPIAIQGASTDGLGLGYAWSEGSNTLSHNTRSAQTRSTALENSTVMAAGVTTVNVAGKLNDMIFFALGMNAQAGGPTITAAGVGGGWTSSLKPHARLALTTELAGLDTIVGGWWARHVAANTANAPTNTTYGLDLQMQGDLGDLSLGFYLPVVLKAENGGGKSVAGGTNDTGYYPLVEVAFGHAGVRVGYDMSKQETAGTSVKQNTFVVGGYFSLAQNFELDLEYMSRTNPGYTAGAASLKRTTLLVEYVY